MPMTGDDRELQRLILLLDGLGKSSFAQQISEQVSEEMLSLTQDCFDGSHDPDGRPWKPLVIRAGKPLLDSGRLRASLEPESTPTQAKVVTNVSYAAAHQNGTGPIKTKNAKALKIGNRYFASTKGIPARPFIPEELPPSYEQAIDEVVNDFLDALLDEE
jgi:phage gpG-like protein